MKPLARISALLTAIVLGALLAACGSAPTYSDARDAIPPVASGKGRIVVYRGLNYAGVGHQPHLVISGRTFGAVPHGGFQYFDIVPGSHEVTLVFRDYRGIKLDVARGQTHYVRVAAVRDASNLFGLMEVGFRLEAVDRERAEREMKLLEYGGEDLDEVPYTVVATPASPD